MLYNGSKSKLTLQAYGGATGASYGSKIIVNGGGTVGGNISFINDNTTTCLMNSTGVGLTTDPREKLDVYGGNAVIRSTNEGSNVALYLGTPFTPTSALKCAFIAQGLSTYSRSKLHICLNNAADNNTFYTAGIADACMSINYNGGVGIGNTNPFDDGGNFTFLNVGDSSISGSLGCIVVGYNNGSGSRHFAIRHDGGFSACIGDYGNSNAIGTYVPQLVVGYTAPQYSLTVNSNGSVYMAYGYLGSDIILKTEL